MAWRIEASGGTGSANYVVIQPMMDDDPESEVRHALITISPKGGREHPTIPMLPPGALYRDRLGMAYRIQEATIVETGTDDGEHSMWRYEYLVAYSATLPLRPVS
jgi:hypothetical protein